MDEQSGPIYDEFGTSRTSRRGLLAKASKIAMLTGLAGGYGAFAAILGRFLYPSEEGRRGWMLVAPVDEMETGRAVHFEAPSGARVVVTRQGAGSEATNFMALSSVCPHLGCQVHWEPHNDRFFCPCHNGVFTPEGKAVEGPPAKEGQSLLRYPVKVENGLLFIEVPTAELALGRGRLVEPDSPRGPGHDPCLQQRRPAREA